MKRIFYFLLLVTASHCREKYTPVLHTPDNGFLVVEGVINSGAGSTNIYLSRSNQFAGQGLTYEESAIVRVEGDDNTEKNLTEQPRGLYSAELGGLSNGSQYRLHITTKDGKEYLSDFASPKMTPPIDTVSWGEKDGGIQVYVSTHDEKNATRYYMWDYVETWEFHSPFQSYYVWVSNGVPPPKNNITIVPGSPPYENYQCWQSEVSTQIIIASTARLSSDIIGSMPLAFIPPASEKLSVECSILVHQFALTDDAYNFLARMKKNTQETGSIFDAQPSELKGNIHCVTSPGETVIGYTSVSSLVEKRIFIVAAQVPSWGYRSECKEDTIVNDSVNRKFAYGRGLLPTRIAIPGSSYFGAQKQCIDCTLRGTNIKPEFWP